VAEHGARGGTGQTGGGALESGNWGEWGNTRAGLCNSISSSFQPPGVVIKGSRAITKRNARCQRAEYFLTVNQVFDLHSKTIGTKIPIRNHCKGVNPILEISFIELF